MARLAVIGEEARVSGFSLAGADVHPANTPAEVEGAWADLAEDVAVVIVTATAAETVQALRRATPAGTDRLVAVMP